MDKRTEIAKDLLAGLLANPWLAERSAKAAFNAGVAEGGLTTMMVQSAIACADELIKQLDNSTKV